MIDALTLLPGPLFLGLFAAWVGAVLLSGRWWLSRDGAGRPLPPVEQFDPTAIAVLRGGARAVVEASLFSLFESKAIDVEGERLVLRDRSQHARLNRAERAVLDRVGATSASAAQVVRDPGLLGDVARMCRPIEAALRQAGLLRDEAGRGAARRWGVVATAVALAPGLVKLGLGLSRERPVFFLAVELALAGYLCSHLLLRPPAATALGLAYLRELEHRFSWARGERRPDRNLGEAGAMAVALFGAGFLVSSPVYAALGRGLLPPPTDGGGGTSGGCSGGCGSGCGGGGCGGGCGGCG